MPSRIVSAISPAATKSCGRLSIIPCASAPISCTAKSTICGAISTAMPIRSGSAADTESSSACVPSRIDGNNSCNIPGRYPDKFVAIWVRPSTSRGVVSTMRGIRLSAAVSAESIRLFSKVSKSWSGSAIPVRKFSHAAPSDAILPWIVVDASFAVVPVISRFSCTTWIASTISAKLSIL